MNNTYYSQLDERWAGEPYTAVDNNKQTIGSSGCGPTAAAMIVSSIKEIVSPSVIAKLFVEKGYRSANDGTYLSAFKFIGEYFNIPYLQAKDIDELVMYLRKGRLAIAACSKGLFTSGAHLISIMGLNSNNELIIFDPYLYNGKFDTADRSGKVRQEGKIAYCSIENFKQYANASRFYVYGNDFANKNYTEIAEPIPITTAKRVKVDSVLNIRSAPGTNNSIVGTLKNNTIVTVYQYSDSWCRIGDNKWVYSKYLVDTEAPVNTILMTVVAKHGLNLREAASTGSRILKTYKYGTKVAISERKNGWAKCAGGYLSLAYLR